MDEQDNRLHAPTQPKAEQLGNELLERIESKGWRVVDFEPDLDTTEFHELNDGHTTLTLNIEAVCQTDVSSD